ncbi:hypothetical protein MMPV_007832 [Pyropia vietnamensis]
MAVVPSRRARRGVIGSGAVVGTLRPSLPPRCNRAAAAAAATGPRGGGGGGGDGGGGGGGGLRDSLAAASAAVGAHLAARQTEADRSAVALVSLVARRAAALVVGVAGGGTATRLQPRVVAASARGSGGGISRCSADGTAEAAALLNALIGRLVPPAHAKSIDLPPPSRRGHNLSTSPSVDAERLLRSSPDLPVRYPPAERIVAVGDVHGDADALRRALRSAAVLGPRDEWVGGKAVLVQVGDQLDRGPQERDVLDLLFKLQDEAPRSGGAVHVLLGNHELMNVEMDFRYVTMAGFGDFRRRTGELSPSAGRRPTPHPQSVWAKSIRAMPAYMRPRAMALRPGGATTTRLAGRTQIAVIVGDTVFVHGGLRPSHLGAGGGKGVPVGEAALAAMNRGCREWLLGVAEKPAVLRGGSSPVWSRHYSRVGLKSDSPECDSLGQSLKLLNVKRMVVGHTPQMAGISGACDGRVWRIDTGMAKAYGGMTEALEIERNGKVRILNAMAGVVPSSFRMNP